MELYEKEMLTEYNKSGFKNEVDLYIDCMQELIRIDNLIKKYISDRHNLRMDNLHLTVEIISLQFRKIFELIAISSLITNKRKFSNLHKLIYKTEPNYIMKGIKRINPNFYPVPIKLEMSEDGKIANFIHRESVFLSEKELIKGWNLCSDYLHIRNPFLKKLELNIIMDSFLEWIQKIENLYYNHAINLAYDGKHFFVDMDFSGQREIKIYYAWAK